MVGIEGVILKITNKHIVRIATFKALSKEAANFIGALHAILTEQEDLAKKKYWKKKIKFPRKSRLLKKYEFLFISKISNLLIFLFHSCLNWIYEK